MDKKLFQEAKSIMTILIIGVPLIHFIVVIMQVTNKINLSLIKTPAIFFFFFLFLI